MPTSLRPTLIRGRTYMFHVEDVKSRLKEEQLEDFQKIVEDSQLPTQDQWEFYCQSKNAIGSSKEEFLCYTVPNLEAIFGLRQK
ncbi:hypothetical protein Forpi1262_v014082 [Fusarium oxysporum f. sp. raphani]|uniref:Uncharacterized protein n=1 Tax=Fusarium oxysporum f. sp. raphani TaxID=96318 RepID=A0A8J5PIN1_FUSOX|nr:hypothetical protein Forpi1262_v014082 [Fusarium oxysporum f. sp. raphani]KAK2692266.1 hypothetical protein QWA68_008232 [Fusarium oxysporum]